MKVHLITYGDLKYSNSKKKLINQAHQFDEFDVLKAYGPEDLPSEFTDKYNHMMSLRGGGYWMWKPIITQKHFDLMEYGDILVYLDAGCTINSHGKERFNDYINMLINDDVGILSFQLTHSEKLYTTSQIFNYLNINLNSEHANSGQYVGGIYMLKKTSHSCEYLNKLVQIVYNNHELYTDIYNSSAQIPEFRDNRHDQSISSLLRKKIGGVVLPDETFFNFPFGSKKSLPFPFWATRVRH